MARGSGTAGGSSEVRQGSADLGAEADKMNVDGEYRYVTYDRIKSYVDNGWIPSRSLDWTHHGLWSIIAKKDKNEEEWRDIPSYKGRYQASSYGRVRSLDIKIWIEHKVNPHWKVFLGRILSPGDVKGYLVLKLSNDDKSKTMWYVAHLIALTFLGEKPDNCDVCHNDGFPHNNRPDNLRYDIHIENERDKLRHGTIAKGEQLSKKLTNEKVISLRKGARTKTTKQLQDEYGISQTMINGILSGKFWRHVPLNEGDVGTEEGNEERKRMVTGRRIEWMRKVGRQFR